MADLIDLDPTPTVTPEPKTDATPAPTDGATTPQAKPAIDVEAAIAAALTANKERDTATTGKTAAETRAAELEAELAKHKPLLDAMSSGDRVAAVRLIAGKINPKLLVDLAAVLDEDDEGNEKKPEPTVEELATTAAKKVLDDEKAAIKAADEAKKKADDDKQSADDVAQLNVHLRGAAKVLREALARDEFPFLKDYGCDPAEYQRLLFAEIEATGKLPEPAAILAKMNAAEESRWKKSRFAPKEEPKERTFEDTVRESFEANKDAPVWTAPVDEDDERAALVAIDAARRNKMDYRRA
jgi:hypothetical protein